MNQPARNADAVTPTERIDPARRESDRRPPWSGVAAVLAFTLLAYQNVSHRDAMLAKDEHYQRIIAKKDAEIAMRKSEPAAQKCTDYNVHMESFDITWCHKRGIWM